MSPIGDGAAAEGGAPPDGPGVLAGFGVVDGLVLLDGLGVGLTVYVPSVSFARITRSTSGSRPMSRLRSSRTWPGMMLGGRRLGV